ncbi:MAG: cytochrome c-type biogenesis CcmF C-terminal domain-containing protein, partial [Pseudomonadota bacterium]
LFAPISREGALVFNNVLLTTATATVLIGTLYPLALEGVTGDKISVGAPYFNMTFVPLMLPLLAALPFGPFLAWKRADLQGAAERLTLAALVGLIAVVATFAVYSSGPWMAPFAMAIGAFVIVGAFSEVLFRAKFGTAKREEVLRRLWNLPRSVYGTALAHAGVGVMVLGITATSAYRIEQIKVLNPGDTTSVAVIPRTMTFKGVGPRRGPNFREQVGVIEVAHQGAEQPFTTLYPAKRIYDAPPQPTSEAGIHASWSGDLYTVLGDPQADGKGYAIRVYFNPLVRFIWIGAVIMFIGGLVSLTDRRLRVGAPRRSSRPPSGQMPDRSIVPAE